MMLLRSLSLRPVAHGPMAVALYAPPAVNRGAPVRSTARPALKGRR